MIDTCHIEALTTHKKNDSDSDQEDLEAEVQNSSSFISSIESERGEKTSKKAEIIRSSVLKANFYV